MRGPSAGLQLGTRLLQKQQLSLEMQLGFRLLQMSQIDLESYLEQEAEVNPFLELIPPEVPHEPYVPVRGINEASEDKDWIQSVEAPTEQGIYEDLLRQIAQTAWPESLQEEVRLLLPFLNEHGFLPTECPLHDWTDEEYHDAVLQFQRLEPAGIGARSVQEALLLQAAARGFPELVDKLVLHHMEDVAGGDFARIQKLCKCSEEDLRESVRCLRQLSPYPVHMDHSLPTSYTRPDVVLERRNGRYEVQGTGSGRLQPKVLAEIDALLRDKSLSTDQKKQLRELRRKAQTILKFCDLREETITRVATVLVERQYEYLEHGDRYLKPLTLKDVAEELNLHESTISRATSGKAMLTDRGLLPLRNFFVQRVSDDEEGDDLVGSAVREELRQLIEKEKKERPEKPYSDQELADMLEASGMAVARRTVAKYRGILEIPSKSQRRKTYRLEQFVDSNETKEQA